MNTAILKPRAALGETVELCGLDLVFGSAFIDVLQYFTPDLDVERLRSSLVEALDRHPMLSGRVRREGGRLFVECRGQGIPFAYVESENPLPAYGPMVFPIDTRDLQHAKTPHPMTVLGGDSLMMIVLTRFANGHYVMRLTISHAVVDGFGYSAFLSDWCRFYEGRDLEPPGTYSRRSMIALCTQGVDKPSERYGARLREEGERPAMLSQGPSGFATARLTGSQFAALEAAANSATEGISVNNLLSAMVVKSFASTSASTSDVVVNSSLDLRLVRNLDLPKNYLGSAVMLRSVKIPRQTVEDADCFSLARLLRDRVANDLDSIKQDMSFYQNEYAAGRFNAAGSLLRVAPTLLNGGIYVNIIVRGVGGRIFGDTGYWGDTVTSPTFYFRNVMIHGCRIGDDVVVRYGLPPTELDRFGQSWGQCVHSVLRA